MNYNIRRILKYIIIYVFFCLFFWRVSYFSLQAEDSFDKWYNLTVTFRGFNALTLTTSIYLILFLNILMDYLQLFRVNLHVRMSRAEIVRHNYIRMLICAAVYALAFVSVNVLFVTVNMDIPLLLKTEFYQSMLQYWFALTILYQVMGGMYLILLIIIRREYIAMLLCFVINTVFYLVGVERFELAPIYDDVGILSLRYDYGKSDAYCLTLLGKDIILVVLLFLIVQELYKRKDILGRL